MVHYDIKITGRVQGVNFRAYTLQKAREHGINGWVRNETDGSVRVNARGEEPDVNAFLGHLRSGPTLARVDKFIKHPVNSGTLVSGFSIRY